MQYIEKKPAVRLGNCLCSKKSYLNSTPLVAQVLQEPLVLRTYAPLAVSRHGSNLLASLENKLSDSASLRYLRRRSLRELRRKS